ncbi:transcriptional regulator icp4 domain-containing protein, partial [Plakobranchus ocellatus]
SGEDSDMGSFDVTGASQDFPVRTVDLRDLRGKVPESSSETTTPGESHTSLEVLGAHTASPAHLEEIQKRMTNSFSRKMQEWEKLKYRSSLGSQREPSPDIERKGSKSRKDDRQKSKRSREDKEKEKLEKIREREMQKVEKEQVKLEKEKLRLEKERLRALEREAKLEKIKDRLSHTEQEGNLTNPVLGPLAEYKVTADFAHKLHQWELKKGLSHDVSNSIYLEAQKLNMQHLRAETAREASLHFSPDAADAAGGQAEGGRDGGKRVSGYWTIAGDSGEKYPDEEGGDDDDEDDDDDDDADGDADRDVEGYGDDETSTSVTEECLVKSNIETLERANLQLIENLQQKEMEYASVQQQVTEVNRKLAKVKDEHAREMARFHRELALGSIAEPVKLEVGELETTINTMEEKIKAMENLGERLALSMESAAVGKWQSIDGEETVHTQLVELVDQMRIMLVQASHSEEESKKSMALSNFEKLYSHAMKLQVQMNNLRLSHLERNREIMTVKRQLLLQEVNNLLLQADITRRETELYQYQAAKKFASLKRWNTFSGSDRARPQAQMEVRHRPREDIESDKRSREMDAPRVNIPYIPEDVILASAASSSLSAPASPSAVEAAGGTPHTISAGGSLSPQHQYLAPTTSSAAGGSSSVAPATPSTSAGCFHHQNDNIRPLKPQAKEESHLSGTATTVSPIKTCGIDSIQFETTQLKPPPGTRTDTYLPQLVPTTSASSPLIRAVSDPLQGESKQNSGEMKKLIVSTQSLESCPQHTTAGHTTPQARSIADGESKPSRQQLSLISSDQTADQSSSTLGTTTQEFHEASGAVHDQDTHTILQQVKKIDAATLDQKEPHGNQTEQIPCAVQPLISASPSHADTGTVKAQESGATIGSDSVPLYNEIKQLRKAKSLVERGSPTLILSKEGKGFSSAPSPGKSPSRGARAKTAGTPAPTIPRQRSLDAATPSSQGPRLIHAAASINDDYSPTSTVMTYKIDVPSGALPDQLQPAQITEPTPVVSASSTTARLSPRAESRRDIPPHSDSSRSTHGKCPRSPVTKHNYLRRQKEERDTASLSGKYLDYKAISPKGSPVATRGKPPLPRQNTPVRQSPHASPAAPEKGPRSKSVGEVSQDSAGASASSAEVASHRPLQDAINKFEKRQTMCETDDRPVELRKTPSPTLHLPRVGLVSRVRRLKPAAELLEESQRYRSGHSIYATRIMQRYLPKEGSKTLPSDLSASNIASTSGACQNNKENTFVQSIVRRLSRETSPVKSAGSSRTNSDLSLKRIDSPRSNSELVSHIVRKLSSGSGSSSARYKMGSTLPPFKDLTNGGQVKKLAESFDDHPESYASERALSDSDIGKQDKQKRDPARRRSPRSSQGGAQAHHRKSCEVAMVLLSTSATGTEPMFVPLSSSLPYDTDQIQRQQQQRPRSSSPNPPPSHQSLPILDAPEEKALSRLRAATYCSSQQDTHQSEHVTQPARPASSSSPFDSHEKTVSTDRVKKVKSGTSAATPSVSPVRRGTGRGKMGTVGVLCKQSISFDLGVTLYADKSQAAGGGSPKSTRQVRSWDPSETVKAEAAAAAVSDTDTSQAMSSSSSAGPSGVTATAKSRPVSSGSEGETAQSASQAEEKNKLKSWLQKSKKFFKVSK